MRRDEVEDLGRKPAGHAHPLDFIERLVVGDFGDPAGIHIRNFIPLPGRAAAGYGGYNFVDGRNVCESMMRRILVVSLGAWLTVFAASAAELSAWTATGDSTFAGLVSGGTDGSILIARRTGADPVRSVDGGRTWTPFTVLGVRPDRFIASPTDSRVFYALAGGIAVDYFNGGNPSNLYRTTDGGATWEVIAAPFVTAGGAPMGDVIVGASPDLLYGARMVIGGCFVGCAYTGAELFVSSDGGRSWRSIAAGLTGGPGHGAYPSPSDARVAYAMTPAGLFRTDDQGTSWRQLPPAPFQSTLRVDRQDPSLIYNNSYYTSDVWVSEDGGQSWRASDLGSTVSGTVVVDPVAAGRAFYLTFDGEVRESRDRGRTWKRAAAAGDTSFVGSLGSWARDTLPAIAASGSNRLLLSALQGSARRLQLTDRALFLGSDLWWNPAESGTGLSITQSPTGQIFAFWYGYDAAGHSAWYYLPGGQWLDDRTFTGTLFSASGPSLFNGTFDASRVASSRIGTGTLRIEDDNHLTFVSVLDSGARTEKQLSRFLFGPKANWGWTSYAGLWWDPAESGWGVSISHQYQKIFAAWYAYDDAGRPVWLVVPDGKWRGDHYSEGNNAVLRFDGDLYTAAGPAAGQPFDASRVVLTRVGSASFSVTMNGSNFPRDSARLDWTAFGQTSSRQVTRFAF
jgi:photosystem II stability/assembly factor-like uncharacterized protein